MALSQEKFDQGMTVQEYIDQIKVNKQPFLDVYRAVDVPPEVSSLFDGLAKPVRLAVFTADWCGDAVTTTPAIFRLAEASGNISVKVFNRDDELALTDSFLPENRAGTVPVFVVFDGGMQEIARFVETANELVPSIDAMDEMIAQEVAEETPEKAKTMGRGQAHRLPSDPGQRVGPRDLGSLSPDGGRGFGPPGGGQAVSGRHQMAA